jgi:hypothetical protein
MAVRWNGVVWAHPHIGGDGYDHYRLNAVSCVSVRACIAVGDARFLDGYFGVWARWNGVTWSEPMSSVVDKGPALNGVSCTSMTACTAVGRGAGNVAELWNGSAWSLDMLDPPPEGQAISCTSSTFCMTAGGGFVAIP